MLRSTATMSMSSLQRETYVLSSSDQNVARTFSCRLRRLGSLEANAPHAPHTSAPVCSTSSTKQGPTRHRQAEPPTYLE